MLENNTPTIVTSTLKSKNNKYINDFCKKPQMQRVKILVISCIQV